MEDILVFICPKCDEENLVSNGDPQDLTQEDVDAFACWNCGCHWKINDDGEVGEELPGDEWCPEGEPRVGKTTAEDQAARRMLKAVQQGWGFHSFTAWPNEDRCTGSFREPHCSEWEDRVVRKTHDWLDKLLDEMGVPR